MNQVRPGSRRGTDPIEPPPATPERAFACAAVILAAGFGRRFGSDKRQWRMPDGRTLLESTLARYQNGFESIFLVLRPEDGDWARGLGGCTKVFAAGAHLGMGHSLTAGIAAARGFDGAFVALGDMPWVEASTLETLRRGLNDRSAIVRPVHDGTPGHPVGFGQAHFDALMNLSGDQGAKAVLDQNPQSIINVEVADAGLIRDLDAPPSAAARYPP
ncbi:MAG: nucleotidyltransferase family protein [Gammaproteobacteria bacterium]|nr:nucleotidyltransferase family protein [Gammaproteobacteria bacterium]